MVCQTLNVIWTANSISVHRVPHMTLNRLEMEAFFIVEAFRQVQTDCDLSAAMLRVCLRLFGRLFQASQLWSTRTEKAGIKVKPEGLQF